MPRDDPSLPRCPDLGHTLKEIHQWAKITHADSVAGINEYISSDRDVEFINLSEALHNRMLAELGERITGDIDNIRLICIAGPSSSGKTTFANRLRIELLSRGINPIRISIDDYYLSRDKAPKDEHGEPDLESIDALDIDLFNQNMLDLIQGQSVALPRFDFKVGKRITAAPSRSIMTRSSSSKASTPQRQVDKFDPQTPKIQNLYFTTVANQPRHHNPVSLTDLRLRAASCATKIPQCLGEETISMWPSVRRGEFTWIYNTRKTPIMSIIHSCPTNCAS
jgi:uridine kinase